VLAGAVALWSCGGAGPVSTSTLTAPTASDAARVHKSDEAPEPDPATDPAPGPTPDPAPGPVPDPAPGPIALTISIVGSFGNNAFTPNPIQASVGDMIVWKNSDTTMHHIVLDDGSVVGDVPPGASSVPVPLNSSAATYYCTIHPTMVGSINGALSPEPPSEPPPYVYYRQPRIRAAIKSPHSPAP
jgi:hypothetical protein